MKYLYFDLMQYNKYIYIFKQKFEKNHEVIIF